MAAANNILITGASSGIGRALALQMAKTGCVMGLLGRDRERLEHVAMLCREKGAAVECGLIDLKRRVETQAWIEDFDRRHPIGLLIANAGVTGGARPGEAIEPPDESLDVIETNVMGVLNSVHPLLPRMLSRGGGQIAIMSSLAAFTPLPDSPSYCASKSAVRTYGLALRQALRPHGVKVNVICPGYVRSPMSRRLTGNKQFEMSAEDAAVVIERGLERNQAEIAFPKLFAWMSRIGGLLPDRIRKHTIEPYRFNVRDAD